MKELVRALFASDLTVEDLATLIDRPMAGLARSRLQLFVRLGRTIRRHREGILTAQRLGLSNARAETLNNKVKRTVRRAYGFHSARAAPALIHLTCGPATPRSHTNQNSRNFTYDQLLAAANCLQTAV